MSTADDFRAVLISLAEDGLQRALGELEVPDEDGEMIVDMVMSHGRPCLYLSNLWDALARGEEVA